MVVRSQKAYAKLNLYLDVVGYMPNGYYSLESVMCSVDLADDVEVSLDFGDAGIFVEMEDEKGQPITLVETAKNTAYRAAVKMKELYADRVISEGFRVADLTIGIHIKKRIPSEAGLGGASADAAAVIRLIDSMCSLHIPEQELEAVGAQIGADVPYCIRRGIVLAKGIGDIMSNGPILSEIPVLLVKGKQEKMSTPVAYKMLDARKLVEKTGDVMLFTRALTARDWKRVRGSGLTNSR